MEKKFEITFNKTILKNIYKSFFISILIVIIWNWTYMYFDNQYNVVINYSLFNTHFYNEEYFVIAVKDIFKIEAWILILIVTIPVWIISVINYYVKFKIK